MDYLKSLLNWTSATIVFLLVACTPSSDYEASLSEALTFYASFDEGVEADFAKGDPKLYTLVASKPEFKTRAGLPEEVTFKDAGGEFGRCLSFNTPQGIGGTRAFYKLEGNFPYEKQNWSGTVSFWLRLTPIEDLRPGFTDPLQLTSRSALDAGIWVDFDRADDRPFRMGAFPDKAIWNPENRKPSEISNAGKPLIPVVYTPFDRDRWTHVVITIDGFNNPGTDAVASLYLNGELQGNVEGWQQQYTWDLESAQIRLGVNFVGDFDELSCFDRSLTPHEVEFLYSLSKGIGFNLAETKL